MGIIYSNDINKLNKDNLFELYGYSYDYLDVFKNSNFILAFDKKELAYLDNNLVGVSRAIGDSLLYATILNVAVSPNYQGLSIGTNLILKLSEEIKEKLIVLNTHPGAVGFYNSIKEYRRNKYLFERRIPFLNEEVRIPKDNSFFSKMFADKGFRFEDEL